jgi:hypothetical protein
MRALQIALFCICAFCTPAVAQQPASTLLSDAYFRASSSVGKFISIERNYSTISLFLPLRAPMAATNFFLDAQGFRFQNGKWAASGGIGFRSAYKGQIFGVNAYYDYRDGSYRQKFHRVGAGVEWLSSSFDLRLNGYLAIGQTNKQLPMRNFTYQGGYFAIERRLEYAYSGADAEFGKALYRNYDLQLQLYGAVGPYYLYHSHFAHVWGGYARLELNWNSLLSFQLRSSYDYKYQSKTQGSLELTLPFDFFCHKNRCAQNFVNRFFLQPVQRNGIILTQAHQRWIWNW